MKLIIDTNVLVSAVLRGGLPGRVFKAIIGHDDWQWLVTPEVLAEYERVIRRPRLGIAPDVQEEWLQMVRRDAILIDAPAPDIQFPRDRKDTHMLQAAIMVESDYLITGDKDFTEAQKLVTSRIVTVAEFARLFGII